MNRRVLTIGLLLLATAGAAGAQVCRLSVAGLNQARRVMGPVRAECPGDFIIHSSPFGNWGVTSNFGPKRDGHQFDGWCHDTVICNILGVCRTHCKDGWYEWNSCTEANGYKPPGCYLYNAKECTEQASTNGANVLGTVTADVPVRCPMDTDGDGTFDSGGCRDVTTYSHAPNFMTLYELDLGAPDELIQTMHFPATPVSLKCTVYSCPPAISDYAAPVAYDSPVSPPKVYAEMATIVNSGTFVNTGACRTAVPALTTVSAASLDGRSVAPNSIATAFGLGLAAGTASAPATPLPFTLGGASVSLIDSAGVSHRAPLYFVSPGQINYMIPAEAAPGPARVTVMNGGAAAAAGTVQIEMVAPGLFAANAAGRGVAAAVAVRVNRNGQQTSELIFRCDETGCVPAPVDVGRDGDQVILLLFGTGIRGAIRPVTATIGGIDAEVLYAGPQNTFLGLDQINVRLPRALAGRGPVDITIAVEGRVANSVQVIVQ